MIQIFVPENSTQQELDIAVSAEVRLLQLFPAACSKYLKIYCSSSLSWNFFYSHTNAIELICQTGFRSCSPLVPLPSPPCKSKCLQTRDACAPFIGGSLPMPPLDCNSIDNSTQQDVWPSNYTVYSIRTLFLLLRNFNWRKIIYFWKSNSCLL